MVFVLFLPNSPVLRRMLASVPRRTTPVANFLKVKSTSIKTLILMKEALDKEGFSPHLIIQPVGYHTPDAGRAGFASLPELPFGKKLILKSWL